MLHAVAGLSEVLNSRNERRFLDSGAFHEVAQSKQLMLCGHVGLEACLARSPQASFFSPAENAAIEVGIQPAERLTHFNQSMVGGVTCVTCLS